MTESSPYALVKLTTTQSTWQNVAMMTITTPNVGNLALSVILFHYGKDILPLAGLVYILIFSHSLIGAVFFANAQAGLKPALLAIIKTPSIWAFAIGLGFALTHTPLPVPIYRMTNLMGEAMIPLMLFTVGVKLSYMTHWELSWRITSIVMAKLMVVPLFVAGVLWGLHSFDLMGLEPVLIDLMVLNYAMPTALICTILAMRHNLLPQSVTMIALVSTVASLASISILLALL